MKKSKFILSSVFCLLAFAARPASAYVYLYHPGTPAVTVDPTVLGEPPSSDSQGPVPSRNVAPRSFDTDETVDNAPVAPVETAPPPVPRHRLAKPFFTSTHTAPAATAVAADADTAPDTAPAPVAAPKHVVKTVEEDVAPVEPVAPPSPPPAPPVAAPVPEPQPVLVPPVERKHRIVDDGPSAAEPVAPAPVAAAPAVVAVATPVPAPAALPAPAVESKVVEASLSPDEMKVPVPAVAAKAEKAAEAPAADTAPAVPTASDLTLGFDGASSTLTQPEQSKLDALSKQLTDVPNMRLQIRGYAKGDASDASSARRMALARALNVRSYLMDKGIKPVRLDVRALGSETDTMPIDRVDIVFVR